MGDETTLKRREVRNISVFIAKRHTICGMNSSIKCVESDQSCTYIIKSDTYCYRRFQ